MCDGVMHKNQAETEPLFMVVLPAWHECSLWTVAHIDFKYRNFDLFHAIFRAFLGWARRSRDGLVESRLHRRAGPPPLCYVTVMVGALGLYADVFKGRFVFVWNRNKTFKFSSTRLFQTSETCRVMPLANKVGWRSIGKAQPTLAY